MSIADKLAAVAENEQKVYDAGYTAGQEAGGYGQGYADGQQAEYDRFWDSYQQNGERTEYYRRFTEDGWTDDNFKPKYPIICSKIRTSGANVFQKNTFISSIPVEIYHTNTSAEYCFYRCLNLVTIPKWVLNGVISFAYAFVDCVNLQNITIEGSIDVDFGIQAATGLTVESAKSILTHLTNYAGTDNEFAYSIKLASNVWDALEADSTAPHGGTWKDYVMTVLCWNV